MTKLMLALAAGSALATAAPLAAQYSAQSGAQANANWGVGIGQRIDELDQRLEAGIDAGTITRVEARSVRQQIRQLTQLERQYLADCALTAQERRDLQQRIRSTRQALRAADGGSSRYAEWNDDDVYGGYDPNNPNAGSGTYPYGSNAGYQEVQQVCSTPASSGLGSVFGRIFGSDSCLRVGERVNTTLSAVPTQYRSQFPPRTGYRYGYLDGHVIEIDSRNTVVTRIFDLG